MKKVLLSVLVVIICASVSFAAAKEVRPAAATGMRLGVGCDNGMAAFKFMGDAFSGSVGLQFTSQSFAGATNTTFGAGGKFVFNLTGGTIPTHAGGALIYQSAPAGNNQTQTTFTLSAVYGAETIIANNLNIGFDVFPLSFSSTSVGGASATTFTLLTGTVYGYILF